MVTPDAPGPMIVPRDLRRQVAPFIGAPFKPKGLTPDGFDCLGYVRWLLKTVLKVEGPTYHEVYAATDVVSIAGRSLRSRLIAERLSGWRPVAAQAGAVAHLSWMGRSGHVGLMLDARRFTHADHPAGVQTGDLRDLACVYRACGFYVPSHVTEILHGGV